MGTYTKLIHGELSVSVLDMFFAGFAIIAVVLLGFLSILTCLC